MIQNRYSSTETANITNCDREPIHIPDSIQPHEMLLALAKPDLTVAQVSSNSYKFIQLKPRYYSNLKSDVRNHAYQ